MSLRRAVVVGAGPAGTSAALGLLRADLDVVVLEQRTVWSDRVCGGFINPEGVRHLAWLGLAQDAIDAGGTWVHEATVSTRSGRSGAVPVVREGTPGLGIGRRALEGLLTKAVTDRRGDLRFGCRVVAVERDGSRWRVISRSGSGRTEATACDLVVLADGRFSSAARASLTKRRHGWFGWNASFVGVPQPPGTLSMHFHEGGYVGVLTFADGSTNVCGLSLLSAERSGSWGRVWTDTLAAQATLATLLTGARRVSEWRGVGPLPFCRGMRRTDGPLLAGDAAAVGDPYMGEGISRALGTGPLIAEALAAAERRDIDEVVRGYNRMWRHRYRLRLIVGSMTRSVQRSPALFDALLRQVVVHPAAARWMLRAAHSTRGLPAFDPASAARAHGA